MNVILRGERGPQPERKQAPSEDLVRRPDERSALPGLEHVLRKDMGLHPEREIPVTITPAPELPPIPVTALIDAVLSGQGPQVIPAVQPRTLFARFRESRFARAVGVATLLGMGADFGETIKEFRETRERTAEAASELRREVLTPTVEYLEGDAAIILKDALPDGEEFVEIGGTSVLRGEMGAVVNSWYTNLLTEAQVPISQLYEDCATQSSGGETLLDAVKCDLLYGDQISLDQKAGEVLANVEGLSIDEYEVLGETIRDSVYVRPAGMVLGMSGILGVSTYDARSLTFTYRNDKKSLYETYYKEAKDLAHVVFDTVDIEGLDAEARADLTTKLSTAIRREIEFSNQLTVSASLLEAVHGSSYIGTSLKEGVTDVYTGERHEAVIDRVLRSLAQTNGAWTEVAQGLDSSPFTEFTIGLNEARERKLQVVLDLGRMIDYRDTAYYDTISERLDSGS